MSHYKPNLRDVEFVLFEALKAMSYWESRALNTCREPMWSLSSRRLPVTARWESPTMSPVPG